MATLDSKENRALYVLVLIFIILAAGIVTTGYLYCRNYKQQYRTQVEEQLTSIANLKVAEIVQWRKERIGDAETFTIAAFSVLVRRFFEKPEDTDAQRLLQTWMNKYHTSYNYEQVLLTDTQGALRMLSPEASTMVIPHLARDAASCLSTRQIAFLDLHRDTSDGLPHMAIMVPIFDEQGGRRPLGLIALLIDPTVYLYPLIQRWPTPSTTAENLLIRREGNDAVFLNELRFQKNTALTLRIPLTNAEQPAVMAALGQKGIVEGLDYRGVPVIADVRPIPDSPWFLVTRMDSYEVYTPVQEKLWMIIFIVGALLLFAGACVGLVWRRKRLQFYRERYNTAAALRASEVRYRRLFESAKDGILILDAETGMVVDVNPFLIELLGFSHEAFIGKEIWELGVFKDTFANQANFVELQQKGFIRYDDMPLETADGRRIKVEFVSNVYLVNHQKVIQCNIRDITERKRAEEAVKKSEIKYRELFDTMNDGFVITDLKGTILECNTAYVEMLGYEKEELKRLSYQDLTPPKWHAIEEHIVNNQFLKRGYSDWYEKEYIRKDGTILSVSHRGRLLKDDQGMPIGIWGFIRNITEEKKAGEELRESEARYQILFEGINDSVFVQYVEEAGVPGGFSQVNDVACQRLGYSREELLALTTRDITTPEAYEILSAARGRLLSKGEIVIETVHVTKDGRKIPTESSVRLFNYLGKQAAISIARDITERKRAEVELKRIYKLLENTEAISKVGGWEYDAASGLISWTNEVYRIHGVGRDYDTSDVDRAISFYAPESAPVIKRAFLLALEVGEPYDLELEFIRANGERIWVRAIGKPVIENGKVVRVTGNFIDITELKHAEAKQEKLLTQLIQSQKMETVGHLAGGIAHDFNNILAAIIGYADLLQRKMSAADPLYTNVEQILSASERAATLVHSLLAFSRKQALSVKQVKINDLVYSVSKLLGRLLGEDITLETVFTGRKPLIMADAGQIDQILFNLSTNARDAMPEGGHLTMTTEVAAIDDTYIKEHGYGAAGDYALITVSDTGAGMDKALQENIFEPFFTTKEVGKGTGLGLSTVYGIVKQHNGFINCYSEPGKGTTFKIYLPLLESDEKAEDEKTGKRTELMPAGNETILVAEDDAAVRELIKIILSPYGYTIYEAEDGAQAVQVFTEHAQEINLLLFDVIMPKKNGKEAYKEIQNIRPGVPVIFTSGYTADIVHKKGFLDDGFELLLKPVSMTALLQKVREVLDRSK